MNRRELLELLIVNIVRSERQSTTPITVPIDTETLDNIRREASLQRIPTEQYVVALVYGALADMIANGPEESESQQVIRRYLNQIKK